MDKSLRLAYSVKHPLVSLSSQPLSTLTQTLFSEAQRAGFAEPDFPIPLPRQQCHSCYGLSFRLLKPAQEGSPRLDLANAPLLVFPERFYLGSSLLFPPALP